MPTPLRNLHIVHPLQSRHVIVTVGEEDTSAAKLASTTLKIWHLERPTASDGEAGATGSATGGTSCSNAGHPTCVKTLKVFLPKLKESQVRVLTGQVAEARLERWQKLGLTGGR